MEVPFGNSYDEVDVAAPAKGVPASIEAERAVLGALMIDPDAIIKIANFLRAADFYRERHGWIYDAMLTLNERREPLDFVTLVEELERQSRLEEIGGPTYLSDLISSTPTAIYVDHYARIVERTAVLRRLISAAGQIAELAYDESQDVDVVVDRAEQIVFGVTESRIHRDLMPIRAIIGDVVERIDFLTRNRDALMGVPTGFTKLDEILGGLQKSDLLIVAARPGMGKSSLALSIGLNAARRNKARVAMFSLEMSNEQLVQRLLAMETAIDSHRLRLGHVYEDEWPILVEAANQLAATPFFLDDTPAASVTDVRTKARRLYAENGLDLIIIDYMQLMSGSTGVRNENRQQEISYISRSLKSLARELNVPIIALSQLSRAVEARSDKRPMLSDLRESGCLTGDTRVYLPDQGTYVSIRELIGQSGFRVQSLDTERWKLADAQVSHAFCTGTKPVYRLTTRLGRTIRATANHPFLTIDGWRRLDELTPGQHIATPRCLPSPAAAAMTARETAQYQADLNRERMVEEGISLAEGARLPHAKVTVTSESDCHLSAPNVKRSLAEAVQSAPLQRLADSDVYWDRIVSIEPDGVEEVYDLTVPGFHCFVADDILVHNSIEQDADVVLFIYREDYYVEDSDRQNVADIIVAKHRHGSTGNVSLFFQKELTQFRDLEIQRTNLDY